MGEMNIAQNIREKRKEIGLTQEQLASFLGISASAVNKWERGGTYPDITLLPALARLLKTDLNTLLSFREDLTEPEIHLFLQSMGPLIKEKGYQAGFDACMEKVRDFPGCDPLILNAALYLDGALLLNNVDDPARYSSEIEKLYDRLLASGNEDIRTAAAQMLISRYCARDCCEQAEELLALLPSSEKKEMMQISLKMQRGMLDEASDLLELRLMKAASDLHSTLMNMMDIAVRQNRSEDARRLAELYTRAAEMFGVSAYSVYLARYELAVREKDAHACMELLQKMLPDMREDKVINCPGLYRICSPSNLASRILPVFLKELRTSDRNAFLREQPGFEELLAPYAASGPAEA